MQSPPEFEPEEDTNCTGSGVGTNDNDSKEVEYDRNNNYLEINLGHHEEDDDAPSCPSSFEVIGSFDNEVMTGGYDHDSAESRMVKLGLKIWVDSSNVPHSADGHHGHLKGSGPHSDPNWIRHNPNIGDLPAGYSPVGRIRGQTEGKMRSPGRYSRTPSSRLRDRFSNRSSGNKSLGNRSSGHRTPADRTSGDRTPSSRLLRMTAGGIHSGEVSVEYDMGAISEDVDDIDEENGDEESVETVEEAAFTPPLERIEEEIEETPKDEVYAE